MPLWDDRLIGAKVLSFNICMEGLGEKLIVKENSVWNGVNATSNGHVNVGV